MTSETLWPIYWVCIAMHCLLMEVHLNITMLSNSPYSGLSNLALVEPSKLKLEWMRTWNDKKNQKPKSILQFYCQQYFFFLHINILKSVKVKSNRTLMQSNRFLVVFLTTFVFVHCTFLLGKRHQNNLNWGLCRYFFRCTIAFNCSFFARQIRGWSDSGTGNIFRRWDGSKRNKRIA
jgi:hypothetical protein